MPLTPPRRSPLTPPPRPPALRWRAVSPAGLQPQEGEAREEQAGGGRRRGNARGATRRGPPLQAEVVASIAIDSRCVEYGFTCVVQFGKYTALLFSLKNVLNSHLGPRSTAGPTVTATKRSIAHNARRGLASPPRAWSIQTGQCSGTRRPPGAVSPSRKRDQEAARSNRREGLSSVLVTSQWCAQEGAHQPARTPWPPRRHPSRGSS